MAQRENRLKTNVTLQEMNKHLMTCRVCQRNSYKRRRNLSFVNQSCVHGDVVGLDFIGLIDGVYFLRKVDYFTRVVQVDV